MAKTVVIQTTAVPEWKDNSFYMKSQSFSAVQMNYIRNKTRHLDPKTTHLVVGVIRPTEKLLSALAKGIWILPERQYLENNFKNGIWESEKKFDFGCNSGRCYEGDIYIPPFKERGNRLVFAKWSVIVLLDDLEEKAQLQGILQSGGANVHQYTLDHVVDFKEGDFLNLKITHIVADPVKALTSEKFRGIIDVNKRNQSRVKIVSHSYVTQFLTSQTRVPWSKFEITAENVIKLHHDYNESIKNLAVHDHRRIGSPVCGIPPDQVKRFIPTNPPPASHSGLENDLPPPLRTQHQSQVQKRMPAQTGPRYDVRPPPVFQQQSDQAQEITQDDGFAQSFENPNEGNGNSGSFLPPHSSFSAGSDLRHQQIAQMSGQRPSPQQPTIPRTVATATTTTASPAPSVSPLDRHVTKEDVLSLKSVAEKFKRRDRNKAKNAKHIEQVKRIKTEIGPEAARSATIIISDDEDDDNVVTID